MTAPSRSSSRRAAPPKRLSLTQTRSFQLSSPPPSSSVSASPFHSRPTPRRGSSISYTTTHRNPFGHDETFNDPFQFGSDVRTTSVAPVPLTLGDRHASLMFQIAEKESLCLELRTQLIQQERDLAALKKRWERVLAAASPTLTVKTAPCSGSFAPVQRNSVSEESSSSLSDSSTSIMTPNDEVPVALTPSPARVALPGTLGLSMMYKEVQAGIVKSEKLKRASTFLNDMLITALGSHIPPTQTPITKPDTLDKAITDRDPGHSPTPIKVTPTPHRLAHRVHTRSATTSFLDDELPGVFSMQILSPDSKSSAMPPQLRPVDTMVQTWKTTCPRQIDEEHDDEEWNW